MKDLRFEDPGLARSVDLELGGVAALIGIDAPEQDGAPGGSIGLTLAWRAIALSEIPLQVSVQLLDEDGSLIVASDTQPGGGRRPTSVWLPGEVVLDPHELILPDLLLGHYSERSGTAFRLAVALYEPTTGARLPVTGGSLEEIAPGLHEIGRVAVTGPPPRVNPGGADKP